MAIFFYYCLYFVVLVTASPLLLFKRKARAGLAQKLGFVPGSFSPRPGGVWFHAVSVGEFNAIKTLLEAFHDTHPDLDVIVSTTTSTGQEIARQTVGSWATVVFLPYDLPWTVSNWLDRARPQLMVIAETEIWPGLIFQCKQRSIKVVAVNGRLSPRSFGTYSRFHSFFSWVFGNFTAFAVQSNAEAERYRALLGSNSSVPVEALGNLKLDGMHAADAVNIDSLRTAVGLTKQTEVLIAGSTHEGEETAICSIYKQLTGKYPHLKLIIVPRHPERFDRVQEVIESAGLSYSRFSRDKSLGGDTQVLLVDTMGQLLTLYSLSDIAFVGGTIAPIGGHNLLEPYLYKVPVACGPQVFKIRETANQLTHLKAGFIVDGADALLVKIDYLLSNKDDRQAMGLRGYEFLMANRGATQRALEFLNAAIVKPSPRVPNAGSLNGKANGTGAAGSKSEARPLPHHKQQRNRRRTESTAL